MRKTILLIILVFCLGWASSSYSNSMENSCRAPLEKPSSFLTRISNIHGAEERVSPFDRVEESQIHVYPNRVEIDLEGAEWASFTDTNSMDPVIDAGANAIEIVPSSPREIHVGDIVSYKSSYSDGTIIHRVIETGYDSEGWYAIFKGDNLSSQDPEKVRFSQIRRLVVAIIY